jgi:AraC-like DNA-binding protein
MSPGSLPANCFRTSEIIQSLRGANYAPAQDFLALSDDVVNYRSSLFGLHDNESLFFFVNTKARQSYRQQVFLEKYVGFIFTSGGTLTLRSDRETVNFPIYNVVISFNLRFFESLRTRGTEVKNFSIMLSEGSLFEDYGLHYDSLPIYIRSALASNPPLATRMMLSLAPRCRAVLDQIFANRFSGSANYKYISAKSIELLCELVRDINLSGPNRGSQGTHARSNEQDQRIITAAEIYRQNIASKVSVDKVARMVGLNRNTINDGFKDFFNQTPGEYFRSMRLNWAREQINNGNYSITELSKLCGYANSGAFSRAYKDFFGKNPTED